MQKIFSAKGDNISSGLHPNMGNSQIPLWKDGSNIVFKDSSVKPGPLQSLLFSKLSGLLGNGIRAIDNDGSQAAVWGDRRQLYRGTDVPTAVNATRVPTLINDLDVDASNWTGFSTTMVDEPVIVRPGGIGGALKFEATLAVGLLGTRDLAAGSTDFTGKVFTWYMRVDTAIFGKLIQDGTAIKIRLSSVTGGLTDYNEYHFPATLIQSADTYFKIELDVDAETADVVNGTPDLTAILSILFTVSLNAIASVGDAVYFDDLEFAGFYTGKDIDKWSIVQFGQSVLATNRGVDEIQYLADIATGVFVNLSDAGGDLPASFRARILQKLGPFIIAFGTDNDNTEARWSTEDNVLVWTPLPTNSARDINLRDMNSDINAVIEFGEALLVIGLSRAHIFQFIGAPLFFGAKKLIDGIGAVGPNAVTEGGRLIFGFSENGIWLSDGSTKQYIDEPDIHTFIYEGSNRYDNTRAPLVSVWEDTRDDEIYFSYPTIDGLGFTVSFSPKLQVWSMHDYWRTAAASGEVWNAPILLSNTGDIFIQSTAGTGSGFDVNPLGLSDTVTVLLGMGEGAMGEQPHGGKAVLD